MSGEQVDIFSIYDDNAHYERHGLGPNYVKADSLADIRVKLRTRVVTKVQLRPGFGFYMIEYFEEGNRAVAILKGRVTNVRNIPYNNTYFFLFEVKDGKVIRGLEDLDGSLSLICLFDSHLEEKSYLK